MAALQPRAACVPQLASGHTKGLPSDISPGPLSDEPPFRKLHSPIGWGSIERGSLRGVPQLRPPRWTLANAGSGGRASSGGLLPKPPASARCARMRVRVCV
eukprot:26138-Alexandrium_andersonii.AAC.1